MFEELVDIVFNGRRAAGTPPDEPVKPVITVQDLIERGTSHVRVSGKVYKIVCKEVEITK